MIKDIKFLATTVQPNPKEVTHWVDLSEDPTGGVIKTFDGKEWKSITSSNSNSDKYVNMTVDLSYGISNEITIDGKVYNTNAYTIYDTDLLNYLKSIYYSDKSLIIDCTNRYNDGGFNNVKVNSYVTYGTIINDDTPYESCAVNLSLAINDFVIQVVDTDFPDSSPA